MTSVTRLIDAYREYLSRGMDAGDAVKLAIDDCEIDGDSFVTIARHWLS